MGGGLIAIRGSIDSKQVRLTTLLTDNSVEYMWVKLCTYQQNKKSLYIGAFYFRPNTNRSVYTAV